MKPVEALRRRRVSVPAIVLIALTSAALAVTTSGAHETHVTGAHHEALVGTHGHATPATKALTARQLAFHDAMRKLWEDHITWTRLAIVSFAGGLPDLQATEARLLANQVDIGNAIKPFYGRTAGNRLSALLKAHILGAVALLQAAKPATRPRSRRRARLGTPTGTRSRTSCTPPIPTRGRRRRCGR